MRNPARSIFTGWRLWRGSLRWSLPLLLGAGVLAASPDAPPPAPSPLAQESEKAEPEQNPEPTEVLPGGKNARREEMRVRMRQAVGQVAEEYGNPPFAEVFTNDPIRARVLRNRLRLLGNYEELAAEVRQLAAEREKRSQELKAEVALLEQRRQLAAEKAARQEAVLRQLQAEASALNARILAARQKRTEPPVPAKSEEGQ